MKVWIVCERAVEYHEILGVFSSQEKASADMERREAEETRRYGKGWGVDLEVEEREVDDQEKEST